jgi:hypothetical protein
MDKSKNITGQKFGRWVVIKRNGNNAGGTALWLCKCECGNKATVRGTELRYGRSRSCGCLNSDVVSAMVTKRNTTHGLSHTPIHGIWARMIQRCHNKNSPDYEKYGGRGIAVCKRWRNSFESFYADMGARPDDDAQIDRINNNGPYSPSNCRWATRSENCSNTRRNHFITYSGKTQTMSQWAREIGITHMTLWKRINRGWSIKRAVTTA